MVMQDHGVEVVLHAAAYKHVPLVEANPIAGLANNVLGTRTLADAAHEAQVKRFVLVSTDKAVRPTNVMGASKRLAELVIQDLAKRSRGTVFSMVRFGNVLGSSGSVIPLFKEQIERGGPVTLTHEDVTRYFMTINEASRLVLLAGSFADPNRNSGGEVYVLDMGKPVRIRDLAEQMIEAAGYTVRDEVNPEGDIEITVIGLRPGEKLHEELLIGEGLLTTPHPKILRAEEGSLTELQMAAALRALRTAVAAGDAAAARAVIRDYVEGFGHATDSQGVM
jgi:FlaA1/EpsC-like NDP-sugar epimerase